ncbi:MAG: amino acid--tRNA ligase-related protein [Candidatus Woesearchaeota archaeon]
MLDLEILKSTDGRFSRIISGSAKAVDEVNDSLMWGARKYLREQGFMWLEVPIMTKITGACENVDTLYKLDHFGKESYLAQTGQLYLEAKIPLHEKVWTIITSSRAESSVDARHLNQFQLVEFEHKGDFESMLVHIEGLVKSMISEAIDKNEDLLNILGRYSEVTGWVAEPFARLSYTEAIDMLKDSGYVIEWGDDLSSKTEQELVMIMGNRPLFITHFPKAIKFFNMRQNDDDARIVNSSDLLMPYSGESVGAAERENNYELLVKRLVESPMFRILAERGKTLDDFKDYLDMVKKHPILHSGCGIGFNRISQSVLGADDIRVSSNYPIQKGVLY